MVNSILIRTQEELDYHNLWDREFGFHPSALTHKQMIILRYMAQGYLNKEISKKLNISENTTKNHITQILRKLDATNRTAAVMKATRWGIIPLNLATND